MGTVSFDGLDAHIEFVGYLHRSAAFAEQLSAMLAEPGNLVRMGQAGRSAVARRYDWANIAQRLEEVYAAIIAGKRDFT